MVRKVFLSIAAICLLLVFSPQNVSAHHQKQVLGESTAASQVVFPPVTGGPGFILPDSPVFFLDKMLQNVKLTLAFTPEQKAKMHQQIAEERLAELRIMFARENKDAINESLKNVSSEIRQAAKDLSSARASGGNVENTAKNINEVIKSQRDILATLEAQSGGSLKLTLKATKESLREAKVEVEDHLAQDELAFEIESELNNQMEENADEVRDSASKLERDLVQLHSLASEATAKQLAKREEVIKKAISEKNVALQEEQERLREEDIKKVLDIKKLGDEDAKVVAETVKKAKDAAEKFKVKVAQASLNSSQSLLSSQLESNE